MEFKEFVESLLIAIFLVSSLCVMFLGIHPYQNFIFSLRGKEDMRTERNQTWDVFLVMSLFIAVISYFLLYFMLQQPFKF